MDLLFLVKSNEDLNYQWFINDRKIENASERTLTIQQFDSENVGMYTLVVSTSSQPRVSMSANIQLDLEG